MALLLVVAAAPVLRAQGQTPDQNQQDQSQGAQTPADQSSAPIPAYRSPLASAAGSDEDTGQEMTPDTNALSGAENLTLGTPTERDYWQPHVDLFATADSNPYVSANGNGNSWGVWTSLSGGIDLHRRSGNNDLTLSYLSGAMFSSENGISAGVVQTLNVSDKFSFHRSSLEFFDSLDYLPESGFGFGGLGGSAPLGGGGGLGGSFTPGQSVLTGEGQNLENSFATELDTYLTPRTSLTFVGGYSVLHYFGSDIANFGITLLNYDGYSFRGGVNHLLNHKDTIAVFYTYNAIRYSNFNQFIDTQTAQVSYGRRVTGRLAFQVAAGPQYVISRVSVTGLAPGGEMGTPTNQVTELLWSLDSSLLYQTGRNLFQLRYDHGVNGGSGVLAGADADIVSGSLTHQVSRTFSDGVIAGYSRNSGTPVTESPLLTQVFDYWFAGATLTHPIGRTLGLTFTYQMQYQTSNGAFRIGPVGGTNVIVNLISVGIGWHERPLTF